MAQNSEPAASTPAPAREQSTAAGQQGGAPNPSGALYRAFDSYPWQKDQEFAVRQLPRPHSAFSRVMANNGARKSQLIYNLYNAAPGTAGLSDVALRARIRRFEEQTKIRVDADTYKQWLAETGGRQPRLVPEQMVAEEAAAMVSTSSHISTNKLRIKKRKKIRKLSITMD